MAKFKKNLVFLLCGGVLTTLSLSAHAQSSPYITKEDLQVAVRAFSFAYAMPKGDLEIEVVYNPGDQESLSEVAQFTKSIGSGATVGGRTVRIKPVPVAQMGSTGDKIAYISHGMQKDYDAVFAKAQELGLLTFTTDFQCVAVQKCVMGIKAEPNIKIEVSRAATEAAGLEFSQALKLMIREVE